MIVISLEHINERMEAYISFTKDNGKAVSNSAYTGSLNTDSRVATEIKPEEETRIRNKDEQHLNQNDAPVFCQRLPVSPDLWLAKRTDAYVPPS